MRKKWWLFPAVLTALICATWLGVPKASEHPWDVDNRPGSGAPTTGSGVSAHPHDTLIVPRGTGGSSAGMAPSSPNRQQNVSLWQTFQWWLSRTLLQLSGENGSAE